MQSNGQELKPAAAPQSDAAWRLRFFTLWSGQALSLLGSGLVQFALVWWLTISTGSATVLAVASLVGLLPFVVIAPFGGVLADRWNRRWIMILSDGIIALTTLALLIVYLTGYLEVWHVYVAMFVRSAAGAFHGPTMMASTTLLVPSKHLTRVSGLNQTLEGITRLASPALGALLLEISDLRAVLLVDIVTALLAIVPLFFFHIPQPELTPEQRARETGAWVLHDMRDGLDYMRRQPGLLTIVTLATGINLLLAPAFALLPLVVNKEYGGGAPMLAAAETLFGVGVVLGGLALAAWGGFRSKIATSMAGLVGIGVGCLLIGFAPLAAFWVVVAGMFLVGIMQSFTNGPVMAIFQTVVEPGMQGRVISLLGSIAMAVTPIGLLVAGPVADALGVRIWYTVGGILCLVIGISARFLPSYKVLDQVPAQPPVPPPLEATGSVTLSADPKP